MNATKSRQGINVYRCSAGGHNRRYQQLVDDYVDSLIVDRLTGPLGRELIDDRTIVRITGLLDCRVRLDAGFDGAAVFSTMRLARSGAGRAASADPTAVQCAAATDEDIAAVDADIVSAVRRDPVTIVLRAGISVERVWAMMDPQWRARIIDSLMTVVILPLDYRQTRQLDTDRIAIHWRR